VPEISLLRLTSGRRTERQDGGGNGVDATATAERFARRVGAMGTSSSGSTIVVKNIMIGDPNHD
jgi:hypothetical protein